MPLISTRPPRRPRFRSSFGERAARTREYYYSLYTILAVKIVLFIFLLVLFGNALRALRAGFKSIPQAWRIILPAAILAMALYIGYHIYKNIKEIRGYGKDLKRNA